MLNFQLFQWTEQISGVDVELTFSPVESAPLRLAPPRQAALSGSAPSPRPRASPPSAEDRSTEERFSFIQRFNFAFCQRNPKYIEASSKVHGGASPRRPGLGWLWFGMFHQPAWAVGSYRSGHQPEELPKYRSTQPRFARRWSTLQVDYITLEKLSNLSLAPVSIV